MAVPNTNTFSLEDVRNELGLGSTASLSDCFAAANSSSFDPAYEGSKDRLSNFRNYGAEVLIVSPTSINLGNSQPLQEITVTATGSWNATIITGASWISVIGGSGAGDGDFDITYTAISNLGRSGLISVTMGSKQQNITVTEIN